MRLHTPLVSWMLAVKILDDRAPRARDATPEAYNDAFRNRANKGEQLTNARLACHVVFSSATHTIAASPEVGTGA